ncbi:MAG: hypothetical protein KC461_12220 [Dehalococcoidia bacterium]|nr:hypothetical protein [Dehalococcoidia bacterium]MCA9851394.1 hypothetical protein [Dehalococcoidia bacterium]MCB9484013.1 hypothetical protein [Dehalococcoidia bacterium]MCB9490472.1 hypothetical protein [Dehalococcoidia bacterium]
MFPRASLKFALLAALAGSVVAFIRHRGERRVRSLAVLQGLEWFLSAGGASLLTGAIRRTLEDADLEVTERLTRVEQTVVDHAPEL